MNQRPISITLQTSFCPFFKVHFCHTIQFRSQSTFRTQKWCQLQARFYVTNYATHCVIRIPQVSQNVALNWVIMTLCQNAWSGEKGINAILKWIELWPAVIYVVKACFPQSLYSMSNACAMRARVPWQWFRHVHLPATPWEASGPLQQSSWQLQ